MRTKVEAQVELEEGGAAVRISFGVRTALLERIRELGYDPETFIGNALEESLAAALADATTRAAEVERLRYIRGETRKPPRGILP